MHVNCQGLTHLVAGCASHWGGEKGSPPLMTGGFVIDDRGYIGGRGIARPGLLPHNVGKFHRGAVVTQMGRSGDTMICEKTTSCSGCVELSVGSEWGCCTAGTLRRYHDLWVANDLHTGAGQCRSGRSAIT